jgi:hypothetical protein
MRLAASAVSSVKMIAAGKTELSGAPGVSREVAQLRGLGWSETSLPMESWRERDNPLIRRNAGNAL